MGTQRTLSTVFLVAVLGPAAHAVQAPVENLRLAAALGYAGPVASEGGARRAVLPIGEGPQGADLNGDGDRNDLVFHVLDPGLGAARNLGLSTGLDAWGSYLPRVVADGRFALLGVSEIRQGAADLNGDGDLADVVVHVLDLRTAHVANTGLATDSIATTQEDDWSIGGGWAAFSVNERDQGGTDLNGDGDASDDVLHALWLPTLTVVDTGLAGARRNECVGGVVATLVDEAADGGTDWNGDGDAVDHVLVLCDLALGIDTPLGPVAGSFTWNGERAVYLADEAADGGADLNADGDAQDAVATTYERATGTVTSSGLAASDRVLPGGRVVLVPVWEKEQGGLDLNGDGDAIDVVLHEWDVVAGTTLNRGLALRTAGSFGTLSWWSFVREGPLAAFSVDEDAQGGTDLNGDGDALDHVMHTLDLSRGSLANLGLAATQKFPTGGRTPSIDPVLAGRHLAIAVSETAQGGIDRNGDGDASDLVLVVFRPRTLGLVTTTLAARWNEPLVVARDRVLVLADEWAGGADLNGDGDTLDAVLHVVAGDCGSVYPLALAAEGVEPAGDGAVFLVPEAAQGGTDLNGDGDAADHVAHSVGLPPLACGTYRPAPPPR